MIELNGKKYKLCFLDTCIVSEFVKHKNTIGNKLVMKACNENYLYCLTIQTFAELRKSKSLFDDLFNYFCILPSFFMKNYNELLQEEIDAYPNLNKNQPISFFIKMAQEPEYYNKLKDIFESEHLKRFFEQEEKDKEETLNALVNWVPLFPPEKNQYTKEEIELWVELVTIKKLTEVDLSFVKNNLHVLKKPIDHSKFLSWRMMSFNIFYKFYFKHRKPKLSDINDILMTCIFPYIDALIIEKEQAEIIRQVQRKHAFVTNLEIMTLKNLI